MRTHTLTNHKMCFVRRLKIQIHIKILERNYPEYFLEHFTLARLRLYPVTRLQLLYKSMMNY